LAVALCAGVAQIQGYSMERFNWDGSRQVHGMTGDSPIELGEQHEISMSSEPVEEHKVIELYEENNWGWPGKDAPENQMPGSWKSTRGGLSPDEVAEPPVKKWETDPNKIIKKTAAAVQQKGGKPASKVTKPKKVIKKVDPTKHTAVDPGFQVTGATPPAPKEKEKEVAEAAPDPGETRPAAPVDTRSAAQRNADMMEQKVAAVGGAEPGSNIPKDAPQGLSQPVDIGDAAPAKPKAVSVMAAPKQAAQHHPKAEAIMKNEPKDQREADQAAVKHADAARAAVHAHAKAANDPHKQAKVDPGRGEPGAGRNQKGHGLNMAGQPKATANQIKAIQKGYGKAFASLVGAEGIPTGDRLDYGPGQMHDEQAIVKAEKANQKKEKVDAPKKAAPPVPPSSVVKPIKKHAHLADMKNEKDAESFVKFFTGETKKDFVKKTEEKKAFKAAQKESGASTPVENGDSGKNSFQAQNAKRENTMGKSGSDIREAVLKNPNDNTPHYMDAAPRPVYDEDTAPRNAKTGIVSKAGILRDEQLKTAAALKAKQNTEDGKQFAKQIVSQPKETGKQMMARWAKEDEAKKPKAAKPKTPTEFDGEPIAKQQAAAKQKADPKQPAPQSSKAPNYVNKVVASHGGLPDASEGFAAIAKEYAKEKSQGHDKARDPLSPHD